MQSTQLMINHIQIAQRLNRINKPTIWSIMTPLAIQTNSLNLGQGFPSWGPPQFFKRHLEDAVTKSNHQYIRAFGSLNYVKAIADFHRPTYGELDPENNICVMIGGVYGLYCSILSLVNHEDQVITFDPSYDCYRPQVQMAGGKTIGIPLIPRKNQSKAETLKKIENGVVSDDNDQWDINFQAFEKALNEKTKIIIINSPHNPIGKVFTNEELSKMAEILQKYPHVIVLEDNVYEGMTFDDMYNKPLPKMAFQKNMRDRTLSVYSAGKIFAATGVRSGWIVGPAELVKAARTIHQYNAFCSYNVIENAIAQSLEEIIQPGNTYLNDAANNMVRHRDVLVKELLSSSLDIDIWIPKGGYFVLADISRVEIMQKYMIDEHGHKRTKDYAFAYQLAHENKVVCIPVSPFYGPEDSHFGQKYVRFAFCKEESMITEAGKRLRQ